MEIKPILYNTNIGIWILELNPTFYLYTIFELECIHFIHKDRVQHQNRNKIHTHNMYLCIFEIYIIFGV